jgi:cold shock CspA family protein
MRHQGRISEWNEERGFGFVQSNGEAPHAFLHISSFGKRSKKPSVGQLITYEIVTDPKAYPYTQLEDLAVSCRFF